MSQLLFIRHAETDLAGTFCGHSDPPINARGEQQINELIVGLSPNPFAAIYSSDLIRAVQTANALSQAFSVPCITTPSLREINFGEWEAMTWAQIQHHSPDYAGRWITSSPMLPVPGGEPMATFESRILEEVEHLFQIATDNRLAIVTHAGVMRCVLRNLLGHTDEQAWKLTSSYCSFFTYTAPSSSRGEHP